MEKKEQSTDANLNSRDTNSISRILNSRCTTLLETYHFNSSCTVSRLNVLILSKTWKVLIESRGESVAYCRLNLIPPAIATKVYWRNSERVCVGSWHRFNCCLLTNVRLIFPTWFARKNVRGYQKLCKIMHQISKFHSTLKEENGKLLGLVAGVEKSDHFRPTMNKSDRSSTIGRPLIADYWPTKVDRPLLSMIDHNFLVSYPLFEWRLSTTSGLRPGRSTLVDQ